MVCACWLWVAFVWVCCVCAAWAAGFVSSALGWTTTSFFFIDTEADFPPLISSLVVESTRLSPAGVAVIVAVEPFAPVNVPVTVCVLFSTQTEEEFNFILLPDKLTLPVALFPVILILLLGSIYNTPV